MDGLYQDFEFMFTEGKIRHNTIIREAATFRVLCRLKPRMLLCSALMAVGKRMIMLAEHIDSTRKSRMAA